MEARLGAVLGAGEAGPHMNIVWSLGIYIYRSAPRGAMITASGVHRHLLVAVDVEDVEVAAAINRDVGARARQRSSFIRERTGDGAEGCVPSHNRRRTSPGLSLIGTGVHFEVVI